MLLRGKAGREQMASWDENAKHGLFTRYLNGKADSDKDGKVTAAEAKESPDQYMMWAAGQRAICTGRCKKRI